MKIPISLLRKLNVRLIIFLDDILIKVVSKEEMIVVRATLIYLLQGLGFLINKSDKEIGSPAYTGDRIFGYRDKLGRNDSTASPREERSNCNSVSDSFVKSFVTIRELT